MSKSNSVDVEKERRSKRKQDLVHKEDNGSGSDHPESDSESESGEQKNEEKHERVEKGLISATETPANEVMEAQTSLVKASSSRRVIQRMFSFEDEETIIRTMVKERLEHNSLDFWKKIKGSVTMSIPLTEVQLYEKTRKLERKYSKRIKKGKSPTDADELRVYESAVLLWGEGGIQNQAKQQHLKKKVKVSKKDGKKQAIEAVDDMEFKRDYYNFLKAWRDGPFPFALALKVVKHSERSKLENMWEESRQREIKLMSEIVGALRPAPASFSDD